MQDIKSLNKDITSITREFGYFFTRRHQAITQHYGLSDDQIDVLTTEELNKLYGDCSKEACQDIQHSIALHNKFIDQLEVFINARTSGSEANG